MLTKNSILTESLERTLVHFRDMVDCGRCVLLSISRNRLLNRTLIPKHTKKAINLAFLKIFPGKIRIFMTHPLRRIVENNHIYLCIDINDAGNERYFSYQNNEQNVLKSYRKYLVGSYVLLKYGAELVRGNLGNFYSACIVFSREIFEKYTKNPSIHEIAGVYTALIHCGVNQARELRESVLYQNKNATKSPKRFG